MTSIPKTAYLDGVAFAINPIFLLDNPRDRDKRFADYELNLALNYDLNKAKSLANCKYEFEAEKVLLEKENHSEQKDEEVVDRKRRHHKHKKHKQRVKNDDETRMEIEEEEKLNVDRSTSNTMIIKNHSASSLTSRSRNRLLESTSTRSNRSMSSHNLFHLGEGDEEFMATSNDYSGSNAIADNAALASSFPSYSYPIETTSLINTAVVGDLMASNKRNKWLLHMNDFQPSFPVQPLAPLAPLAPLSHLPPPPHFVHTSTGNSSSNTFFLPSAQATTTVATTQPQQLVMAPSVPSVPPLPILSHTQPQTQLPSSSIGALTQTATTTTTTTQNPTPLQSSQPSTSLNTNTNIANTNANSYFFLNHPYNMSVSSLLEPTVNQTSFKTVASTTKDDINNNIATSTSTSTGPTQSSSNIFPTPSTNQKSTWNTSTTNNNNNNKKYTQLLGDILGDSLDPFHDMELKTINDYEELKNILTNHQPIATDPQQSQLQQQQPTAFNNANLMRQNQLFTTTVSNGRSNNTDGASMLMDNYGLPNISFVDLDIKK